MRQKRIISPGNAHRLWPEPSGSNALLRAWLHSKSNGSEDMRVVVNVDDLIAALKTMKPKLARGKALRDPTVKLTAGGQAVELLGEFENSTSAPAEVLEPGACVISLNTVIRVLSTYPKKAKIKLRSESGAYWIDKMRLSSPA
jgi:hypothetical protein